MKPAHWDFYWPKYASINFADVWTCEYRGASHVFRLIAFCISNRL